MFWRNPSAAFFNFVLPLLFLAGCGAILSGNQHDLDMHRPRHRRDERDVDDVHRARLQHRRSCASSGVLKRIRGTPLPSGSYLGGVAANAVTNTAIQIAIVVLAGRLLFGIGWPRDWASLIVFVRRRRRRASPRSAWRSRTRSPTSSRPPAYVNAVFLPVIVVSFYVFDAASAPGFLRTIADALPLKP